MEKWFINKYGAKCECKREFPILKEYTQHFNVGYEWEDSITEYYCPMCEIKHTFCNIKSKIKRNTKKSIFITKIFFLTLKSGKLQNVKFYKDLYKVC